jgi:hypothetical protein
VRRGTTGGRRGGMETSAVSLSRKFIPLFHVSSGQSRMISLRRQGKVGGKGAGGGQSMRCTTLHGSERFVPLPRTENMARTTHCTSPPLQTQRNKYLSAQKGRFLGTHPCQSCVCACAFSYSSHPSTSSLPSEVPVFAGRETGANQSWPLTPTATAGGGGGGGSMHTVHVQYR